MIRHNEIDIDPADPFRKCQLDRKKYADVLTSIVSTYSSGFVLAINNKWGAGKTTFVKMWEQDLKNKKYQTVYFNAWENDFENNPLTALMGELKTLTKKDVDPNFEKALKNAALFTKNIAPALIKILAKKYIGEGIEDIAEGVTKGVTDIFENDVNEYTSKKKSIKIFKESLSKFIADTNEGQPLIFIVDELDRCRPDYAVAILEQIKHFFSVPNIVFVLSIDKEQLGNAIRGVYGSELIDAEEYLRRFIDMEYSIPEPEVEKYCGYLYNYFGFKDFFESISRLNSWDLRKDSSDFITIANILFKKSNISLRQQEKIFAHARLVLRSFSENSYVIPSLFLLLIYIKVKDINLYNKIRLKKILIQDLQVEYFNIIKSDNNEDDNGIVRLEAYLMHYYNNYQVPTYERTKLYYYDNVSEERKLLISSLTDKTKDHEDFLQILMEMSSVRGNGRELDISHLLKKIDLTEAVNF
ncbi:P-loop NTPase fold protein [Flavobacterium sp. FlaQc-52]|jgi:hypothetical protein|uniref:KAP family P-loop NTPase fold protein n=1 Tax=Flavobacterium sp. FlaQc-52 TaxID=3374185 RepID=UPI0037566940